MSDAAVHRIMTCIEGLIQAGLIVAVQLLNASTIDNDEVARSLQTVLGVLGIRWGFSKVAPNGKDKTT